MGNCHYQDGNYKAEHRIEVIKKIIRQVGIDEDRVWLRWIDASDGKLFSEITAQMAEELRRKGPNPMREPWQVWQETIGCRLPASKSGSAK